jgi:DNA-binding NarL/FixJ family response regulator
MRLMTTPPIPRAATIRVLVADDHPIVLAGAKALINATTDMVIIGEASDGRSALSQATELKPDVMVLDISMSGLDGARVAELLREASPATKILVHTVHEEKGYLRRFLELGVAGYLLKRSASEEMVRAIRAVASGGYYLDPAIAGMVVGRPSAKVATGIGAGAELSEREIEVLKLTAAGYSHKTIAAELCVSIKTVETYKARGIDKLGFKNRVDLVRYAASKGWLNGIGS